MGVIRCHSPDGFTSPAYKMHNLAANDANTTTNIQIGLGNYVPRLDLVSVSGSSSEIFYCYWSATRQRTTTGDLVRNDLVALVNGLWTPRRRFDKQAPPLSEHALG